MHESKLKETLTPLCTLLGQIQDTDTLYNALRDLMTTDELQAIALRRDIAQRIHTGETYTYIAEQTGASSTTIARVAKYLKGDHGGYTYLLSKKS